MAAEANTTMQTLIVASLICTEQFTGSIKKLQILGVTRLTPMPVGNQIKIYKSEVQG